MMRCVMIGADRLMTECATQWRDHGHHVVAIVSDRPAMIAWAAREGIVCLDHTSSSADAELPDVDYLFHLSNPPAPPPPLLAMPRCATIHLHDGPAPGYAGLHPPVWALLNGERRHGISWRLMSEGPDDGGVLLTRGFDIDEDDSALSMYAKCFIAARGSFAELIAGLANGTLAHQRPDSRHSHSHGLDPRPPAAGMIDWHSGAQAIAQMVRALDHGCHANLLTTAKIGMGGHILLVGTASVQHESSGLPPGTILSVRPDGMVVATATRDLRLGRITTCSGKPALPMGPYAGGGYHSGAVLDRLSDEQRLALSSLTTEIARLEPWWRARLVRRNPLHLPFMDGPAKQRPHVFEHLDQTGLCGHGARSPADRSVMATLVAYLARIADQSGPRSVRFDLGYADPVMLCPIAGFEPWFATQFPLDVALDFDHGLSVLREALGTDIRQLRRKIGHAADLFARLPELRREGSGDLSTLPVVLQIVDRLEQAIPHPGAELVIALRSDSSACRWFYPPERLDTKTVAAMRDGFATFLAAAIAAPDRPLGTLPLIAPHAPEDRGEGLRLECGAMDLYCMLNQCGHVMPDDDTMAPAKTSARALDFSISCFPGLAYSQEADRYRLLLESAKFADDHGYMGIWTPAHHFHIPDGSYPAPAVASAAIAAVALFTKRVQIRAGSVVFPSDHPFRVAEEWALIDNLSHGRVALAATGCFHQDPRQPHTRAAARFAQAVKAIATLRSFWRGSEQPLPGLPGGETIHPRPVQPDLPVWIASAEHDDTFAAAGKAQTFVLTHLLTQSIEDLAERVALYRSAWKAAGHAGHGHVTLLLPTFLGPDLGAARAALGYFLKDMPGTRRSTAHTLIGSLRNCLDTIRLVQAADIDEIAFMVDFGLPIQTVLDHLPDLNRLRDMAGQRSGADIVRAQERVKPDKDDQLHPVALSGQQIKTKGACPESGTALSSQPGKQAIRFLREGASGDVRQVTGLVPTAVFRP